MGPIQFCPVVQGWKRNWFFFGHELNLWLFLSALISHFVHGSFFFFHSFIHSCFVLSSGVGPQHRGAHGVERHLLQSAQGSALWIAIFFGKIPFILWDQTRTIKAKYHLSSFCSLTNIGHVVVLPHQIWFHKNVSHGRHNVRHFPQVSKPQLNSTVSLSPTF